MSIQSDKLMNLGDGQVIYNDLRGRIENTNGAITSMEETTATAAHAVGNVISVGGQLYVVTAAIAVGDTIAEGTNVESTTVMAQMAAITGLPTVSSSDNGKVLRVSGGTWAAESLPSASGVSF